MEQFDQFFKKKFQERQFELNQEHWAEAEQLIIAQEKKKRRRWLFFWFFGSLMTLSVLGILWFTLQEPTKNTLKQTVTNQTTSPKANENNLSTETPETKTKTIDQLTSNTPEEGAKVPVDATKSSSSKAKTTTTNPTDKNSNLPSSSFNLEAEKTISKLPPNQSIKSEKQSPESTTQNQINLSTNQANKQSTDNLIQAFEEVEKEKASGTVLELNPITSLEIALLESTNEYSIKDYLPNERKESPLEAHNKSFLSADFNISAYPYFSSETKSILGFKAGLSWGKPLNQVLTLITALNYEFRGGTFDRYKESNRVAYRFSKAEERFVLVPDNLHYAEVASLLAWQRGKSLFETGVGLNYLIGIRGELQRFTSEDNFESASVESKGWLVEDGFKKWHVKAMLGYSHRFSSKLGLGIRLNYAIGTILDKNYQTSEVFLRENQPLTLDLRFRYFIF